MMRERDMEDGYEKKPYALLLNGKHAVAVSGFYLKLLSSVVYAAGRGR